MEDNKVNEMIDETGKTYDDGVNFGYNVGLLASGVMLVVASGLCFLMDKRGKKRKK